MSFGRVVDGVDIRRKDVQAIPGEVLRHVRSRCVAVEDVEALRMHGQAVHPRMIGTSTEMLKRVVGKLRRSSSSVPEVLELDKGLDPIVGYAGRGATIKDLPGEELVIRANRWEKTEKIGLVLYVPKRIVGWGAGMVVDELEGALGIP